MKISARSVAFEQRCACAALRKERTITDFVMGPGLGVWPCPSRPGPQNSTTQERIIVAILGFSIHMLFAIQERQAMMPNGSSLSAERRFHTFQSEMPHLTKECRNRFSVQRLPNDHAMSRGAHATESAPTAPPRCWAAVLPGGRFQNYGTSRRQAGPSPIFTTIVTNVTLASPTRPVTSQQPGVEKIT